MTEKRHNFQIASKVVADGKNKSIVIVADSESKFGKDLAAMKPGDFFAAALQHVGSDPFDFATSLDPYILHPGEAKQNVFVFAESTTATKDGNDNMQVKLFKLGQFVTVNVPAVAKDRVGNKMPDPQIVKAVGKFAKGDSVEVTIQGGGPSPTIKTIELYCVPRDAVFSKLSESDVEGGKTPAIEVTIDGAATTILVPGKASPKGWVPDASLAAAIKKFKDGDKVVVRFLSDEGKNWLKEITKAPPEPAVKS
jgi:ribosomal protein L21E